MKEARTFESVRVRGYKVTRNSSVTVVTPNGTSTTFKHGDHVTFAAGPGGTQTLTFTGAKSSAMGRRRILQGRDLKDKLVIWMPNLALGATAGRGGRGAANAAINTYRARAAIGFAPASPTEAERALAQSQEALLKAVEAVQAAAQGRGGAAGGARGRGALTVPDFTTAQRVDAPVAPQLTAGETFFNALFAGTPGGFAELKAKAEKGEPLTTASLAATITIAVDNSFETVFEQRTRNVVGMIEGTDPALKDTYVLMGAHLDHISYSQTGAGALPSVTSCRSRGEQAQAAVRAAGKVVQNPGRGRGATGAPATAGAGGGRRLRRCR